MKYLSVCSGIEAATCAWHPLGWKPVGFSEIERFPSAVLAHHYPDVPNFGDMTKFQEWPDDLAPSLLVGGTPCQSFSVAGLRKGLADPRGNLALVYLALADRYRPEWLVWENVPGVLSSNGGRDFGAFLGALVQLGYGFAYRVLDAQYFGVAQRRRRVFVVANARDWRRAAAVLFERHSLSGHPAPRRETGQGTPTCAAPGASGHGWPHEVAPTLTADYGDKMGLNDQHVYNQRWGRSLPEIAACLTTGVVQRYAPETETLIPTFGGGFDVAHVDRVSPTLTSGPTSQASHGKKSGTDREALVVIAFGAQNSAAQGDDVRTECSPTLDKSKTPAVAFTTEQTPKFNDDCALTLTKQSPTGGGQPQCVAQHMAVRRLTPIECERLQGFRDDYTRIPWRGRAADACPDGPRYKALGNSMAVPVMRWIGERIAAVAAQSELEAAA